MPAHRAALGLVLVCALRAGSANAADAPPYAEAIEQELARIDASAQCAPRSGSEHRCSWSRAARDGAGPWSLHAVYSTESDTVYLYVERLLVLPSDHPRAPAVLRRLMELNWELLVGKFEWNARTGEVRASTTLNTDSNFDRRAFRSAERALVAVAERYHRELHDLARP